MTDYTCVGKGGRYEYLGHAKPAGSLKALHGDSALAIYRCRSTGQLYFRDPREFQLRMQRIGEARESEYGA